MVEQLTRPGEYDEVRYGEGLDITRRMIVLTENSSSFEERGLSRETVAGNAQRLRSTYGMPMLTEPVLSA